MLIGHGFPLPRRPSPSIRATMPAKKNPAAIPAGADPLVVAPAAIANVAATFAGFAPAGSLSRDRYTRGSRTSLLRRAPTQGSTTFGALSDLRWAGPSACRRRGARTRSTTCRRCPRARAARSHRRKDRRRKHEEWQQGRKEARDRASSRPMRPRASLHRAASPAARRSRRSPSITRESLARYD